jgi:hypothetical protein
MRSLIRLQSMCYAPDADAGLHQRIDPLGQPKERGAARAVQRQLMAAIEHGVAQLCEPALDEAAFEETEPTDCSKGIVVTDRDQDAKIAESELRQRLSATTTRVD